MTKHLRITVEGKQYDVTVETLSDDAATHVSSPHRPEPLRPLAQDAPPAPPIAMRTAPAGAVPSPLAGVVMSIDVSVGQQVKKDDLLVTLEAMKMKTRIHAPAPGKVLSIEVGREAAVQEGQTLVVLGS